MQYLYHPLAGATTLQLQGDAHRYLFRVRRHKEGDRIALRNLQDATLFYYTMTQMDRRTLTLAFESSEIKEVNASYALHLGWCMIDPKNIEKMLPTLNEMGVQKLSLIYCHRSQKSFKVDLKRLEKILLNSSQQSGRSSMMRLEIIETLQGFLDHYPHATMVNFSTNRLERRGGESACVVVGCEGGFDEREVALFEPTDIVGLNTPLILKSESAVVAVASKLLL
jgi:16S rRNA (uracil1498-N3)-methyltransferase